MASWQFLNMSITPAYWEPSVYMCSRQCIRFCQKGKEVIWYLLQWTSDNFVQHTASLLLNTTFWFHFREIPHCQGMVLRARTPGSRFDFLTQGWPTWVTVIGSECVRDQTLGQWRAILRIFVEPQRESHLTSQRIAKRAGFTPGCLAAIWEAPAWE